MKKKPLYVVTGFLSTGKTTFIKRYWKEEGISKPLLISFESGMTEIEEKKSFVTLVQIEAPEDTIDSRALYTLGRELSEKISQVQPEEVWIEWNGMSHFRLLERLLYETPLEKCCKLKEVYYITSHAYCKSMMGKTGDANLSQLANADSLIIVQKGQAEEDLLRPGEPSNREKEKSEYKETKEILQKYHIDIPIQVSNLSGEGRKPIKAKENKGIAFIITLLFVVDAFLGLYFFGNTYMPDSLQRFFAIFTGIFLQAFPFLLVGVVLSAAIQYFAAPDFLEKILAKNIFVGILFALLGGFLFPVCDCSTIPIFRSMVARKIPIPVGMTFMLASPIINPITLLSTFYAFGADWHIALHRGILGGLVAVLVGLTFWSYRGLDYLKIDTMAAAYRMTSNQSTVRAVRTRFQGFVVHSQQEFYRMGSYLLMGIFLSSAFQVYLAPIVKSYGWTITLPEGILLMMVFGFFLSLCSSSDAMIAKTLGVAFPATSYMSFMLMGPMMDLKNVFMLSALFPKKFVLRLGVTIAIIVMVVAFAYSYGILYLHI